VAVVAGPGLGGANGDPFWMQLPKTLRLEIEDLDIFATSQS
jgi:hypothetical protein